MTRSLCSWSIGFLTALPYSPFVVFEDKSTRMIPTRRAVPWAVLAVVVAAVGAGFFVYALLVGVTSWTHPIPYWDMWDGHYSFWFQLLDGNTAIWWELSNEHHLLLLKAIFWLDLALFSGSTTFMIVVNVLLLVVLIIAILVLMQARLVDDPQAPRFWLGFLVLAAVVITIITAWMQGEDLTIGYHSQWVLITLLPIGAFLFLGMAARGSRHKHSLFWIGFAFAILSPWAAASGLLVPFVAAGLVFLFGMSLARVGLLIAVGIVSIVVYSIGHPLLGGSGGGLIQNLTTMPIDVARFWLLYLGGPWSRVTDNQWVGGVAGFAFILIVVTYLVTQVLSKDRSPMGLTTVAFPVFMLAMAFVTAAGRISYGIEQVSALRYLTPMLGAWACLLALAAPTLQGWFATPAPLAYLGVLVIPALLLPEQVRALEPPWPTLHDRDTATLAIALNALDPSAIGTVYPISPERPLDLGQRAIAEGIGVFRSEPYASIAQRLGTEGPFAPQASCTGWLDSRTPLEGSQWDRIDGWLYVEGQPMTDGIVTLTDSTGMVVGFADVGKPRPDVVEQVAEANGLNGYSGYLDRSTISGEVFAASPTFRCTSPLMSAVP